jgi:photosynthetic reaction center cytochrome c subunit
MSNPIRSGILYAALFVAATAGSLCAVLAMSRMDHPPIINKQIGYRGLGLGQVSNPRTLAELRAENKKPPILAPADADGEKASEAYQNVRVLRNLSAGQLTRLMVSMTTWVAPEQGCAYCHNVENMALDTNYQKVVARRMLQMTQNINGNWQSHVKGTGVTCYTCHRGNPVPKYIWFNNPGPAAEGMAETQTGMAHPTERIGDTSLPYDPFTPFLEHDNNIRVQGGTALRTNNLSSMKQAEWTYALMIAMAQSLGVNCDYCHNTRALRDWSQSTPARVTAWYGIRMVRDLNNHYLDPLNPVFPPGRKGVMGDSPKLYCATCHQGINKPLYGVSMLSTFKTELGGPPATTAALLAPYIPPPETPAAAPAPDAPAAPPPPAGPQK